MALRLDGMAEIEAAMVENADAESPDELVSVATRDTMPALNAAVLVLFCANIQRSNLNCSRTKKQQTTPDPDALRMSLKTRRSSSATRLHST